MTIIDALHWRIATNYNLASMNIMVISMRANAGIFIFILLLLLVGTAGAYLPDKISFTNNPEWVIANNVNQSTITVTITNQSHNLPLSDSRVLFNVTDSSFGNMNPLAVTTSSNGVASGIFEAKTKSGNATITVSVTNGTDSNTFTIFQNIDHEIPVKANLQYPFEGEVGSNVTFNISVIDRWGNLIDGRNPSQIHNVSLRIDGPANDCGFKDGNLYPRALSRTLDIHGNLSMQIRLSNTSGDHNIQIASPFTMAKIAGIATGVPVRITGNILKSGGAGLANNEVRANNTDYFILEYFLYDVNGNPVQNRSISVHTNLTDELIPKNYTSNSRGQIQIKYGPKYTILTSKITANSTDNPGVGNVTFVKFVNSEQPTNLILIITPETMASRDIPPGHTTQEARVLARITDYGGNPIPGQDVTFRISSIVTAPYNETGSPSFNSGPVVPVKTNTTDSNGNAIVTFYPGSFKVEGEEGYSDTATGSCMISAASGTLTPPEPVKVEWKNFPYLSVTANATPQTVPVNTTIDVTIRITGDGYNMVNNPITVMLDMDETNSLDAVAQNETNGLNRHLNAKEAAKYFVDTMSAQDQIGLVSYGNFSNNIYWKLYSNASYGNKEELKSNIDALTMKGGLSNLSLKQSIDVAVDTIVNNPTKAPKEIEAIITIGDSSYQKNSNDFNDMVQKTNGVIRIYSILYVSTENSCDTNQPGNAVNLKALADATHGKYYCGTTREQIDDFFEDIKRNLTTVTTDANMTLDFSNVPVNSDPIPGGEVFSYVPVGPFTPLQTVVNPNGRTSIIWPNGTQSVIDQSDNWTAANNYQLKFVVGAIRVKETWEATFRLKVNKTGIIQLFGPGSTISYNGGSGTMKIPHTYINSLPGSEGLHTGTLKISNLIVSGPVADSIPLQWNLNYTGFATATETIEYSYNNLPWIQFDEWTDIANGDYTQIGQLDVRQSPGMYRIRVHAIAPDGEDEKLLGPILVGKTEAFIKLT